jgi:uncharacterized membrane protein
MNIQRITRHLLTTEGKVARAFPAATLNAIEQAIKASEARHAGQIRFVVEGALDGSPLLRDQSPAERAMELFGQLRVWDTEHNNGLLIYLLLADRAVEIVADRGIHARVGGDEWQKVCRQMEAAFRQSDFESGVVAGVQVVTHHLMAHFPSVAHSANELPDKPLVL